MEVLDHGRIHDLALAGNLEGLQSTLAPNPQEINSLDEEGRTALHCAAYVSNSKVLSCLEYLLSFEGVDVDAKDKHGLTALHIASIKDNHPAVKLLIQKKGSSTSIFFPFFFFLFTFAPSKLTF
jgi:ankyrin repeat protein